MLIVLPFPDSRLSPNARIHWSKRSPVAKKARQDAAYATMEACGAIHKARATFAMPGTILVRITAYPPNNQRRDRDNIIASLKHALDGIADALSVDDSRFELSFRLEPSQGKPGRVEVMI